jgi:hypothetical protein
MAMNRNPISRLKLLARGVRSFQLIFPLHIKHNVVLRIAELFVVVTVQQLLAAVGASISDGVASAWTDMTRHV